MGRMAELDSEMRDAIESGVQYDEMLRLYEHIIGADQVHALWSEYHGEDDEDVAEDYDGQPSEYTEWQDYMGGDDWDHGQYESEY